MTPPAVALGFRRSLPPALGDLDLHIHPGDAMYRFSRRLCRGVHTQGVLEYLRSGYAGYRAVAQVLDRQAERAGAGGWNDVGPVLDFGCGHGRLTRFLVQGLDPGDLWSAEADPSAVAFVSERFGVRAAVSPTDPADLHLRHLGAEPFGAIFALSVLSHLPRNTFEGWLERWLGWLRPGGVLAFSTLGPSALLPGRTMPEAGFHFERMSESKVLDLEDYGTSWVTPDYVEALLKRLGGGDLAVRHLPRALWHLQDLWWVIRDPAVQASLDRDAAAFDPGPAGYLESLDLTPDRSTLTLSGWAVGRPEPFAPAALEIAVGDRPAVRHRPDMPRDVLLGGCAVPAASGFEVRLDAGDVPFGEDEILRVEAVGPNGARHVLHLGGLEAADAYLRLLAASGERDELRDQVDVFEASGFGRLRRRWMALKGRRLGGASPPGRAQTAGPSQDR
ncbi:MAG: class I SAM-dependent methyltransferase [Acidobacteriota bacterium]